MSKGPRPPERAEWRIASVTAHRELVDRDMPRIHDTMRLIVTSDEVDAVYFGGARGGDTEALKAALYFRGEKTWPWFTVVVPDTIAHQPLDTHYWTRQANDVVELRNTISKADAFLSYRIRDRYLVDCASFLVAFFNGDYKSGTGLTVKMAEKDGLFVLRVPIGPVVLL